MQLDTLRTYNDSDIAEAIRDKRAIILSPRLRNRNSLLSSFLTGSKTYYYSLLKKENDLLSFLQNLANDLVASQCITNSQVLQAIHKRKPQIADLVDALIADLNGGKLELSIFILDQFDNLPISDESNTFFEQLVAKLPRTLQLVVNGRVVSYLPWQNMVEQKLAIVLGEGHIPTGGIFTLESDDRPHLEVFGFGLGAAFINGLPISTWDGPLVKYLFFFSVDRQSFTRDEVFETFWPTLPKRDATNVWHVSKRKMSELLGYDLLTYSGKFYRLSDNIVIHNDTRQFDELCAAAASADSESRIDYYWQAIKLYRSEFLHLSDGIPWIHSRREQRQGEYGNALAQIGRMYHSKQQLALAISYYLRALRELPLREDVHRKLLEIYVQNAHYDQAAEHYFRLERLLQQRLNITPAKETMALYQSIRSKQ